MMSGWVGDRVGKGWSPQVAEVNQGGGGRRSVGIRTIERLVGKGGSAVV